MKETRGQEVKKFKEEDIFRISSYYMKTNTRMYALFLVGINLGLRISDLIRLKFEDITLEKKVYLIEKKTQKKKMIKLNKGCQKMVEMLRKEYFFKGIEPKGYLFKSYYRKYMKDRIDKPITIVSINRFFNEVKIALNIPYPIGTHSLRKTWSNYIYKKEKDISLMMGMLNHSSEKQTLTYIGDDEDRYEEIYDKYVLGFRR